MDNTKTIGNQIRVLRTTRQLTLDDLAAKVAIHPTWLSRIENGIVNPTPEQLARIKAALNWPSDEAMDAAFRLLAGEPSPCDEVSRG